MLADHMDQMAIQLNELLVEKQKVAISEERNRLARELHDSAKQQAFAAAFQLGSAISKLDRNAEKDEIRNKLLETQAAIHSVQKELTDLIHELRPQEMEGRTLIDAIKQYATEWAHRNDIEVTLDIETDQNLALERKQALYRVLQEGLANIAKHSHGDKTTIRLFYVNDIVHLEISDNGIGFDVNQPRKGVGINSMRERVQTLSGQFRITSQIGRGTSVSVEIPCISKKGY